MQALQALQDLQIDRTDMVARVPRRYPLAEGVEVIPVGMVRAILENMRQAEGVGDNRYRCRRKISQRGVLKRTIRA